MNADNTGSEPPEPANGPSRSGLSPGLVLGLGLLFVILVSALIALALQAGWALSTDELAYTIRGWGAWGVVASIGLMVMHSFVFFPAEIIAFANGMIYGVFWGTLITWTGAMLGASVAFGLVRRLGRPFAERMVAERHWEVLDDWAERNGWQVVLVARFIPVIAFNLINYAAGLTRLSWWQFLWTTGVGILPLTTLMVAMGDNIDMLGWELWLALVIAVILLWLTARIWLQKKRTAGD